MRLIDSHCHVSDADFPLDQMETLASARASGVDKIIVIGTDEADSISALDFAQKNSGVWASVGVHPHEAKKGINFLRELDFNQPKLVAIGEIGLDYHYDHSPHDVQKRVLREQIELALGHNLPIIFHVREAFTDFWPIVGDYDIKRAVVHSYSDNLANLEEILANDWYVGINGLVTFTKNKEQIAAFRQAPLERILLETDAPYLAPKPKRGEVNQPAFVSYVAEFLAQERGVSPEYVATVTSANVESLFSI